jgi:hypothetical protein
MMANSFALRLQPALLAEARALAIAILRRPRVGEPPQPGDELPEGWLERQQKKDAAE